MKITERGWAGHFTNSDNCLFRRNTLIEHEDIKIVVSTVGNLLNDNIEKIGVSRYYETMAFHADYTDTQYYDADVAKPIDFNSPWAIKHPYKDNEANSMHDTVIEEIIVKLKLKQITR